MEFVAITKPLYHSTGVGREGWINEKDDPEVCPIYHLRRETPSFQGGDIRRWFQVKLRNAALTKR
jgi:hypothetical protein